MKVFIINSFRSMVYIAYLVIIGYGAFTGYVNSEIISETFGLTGTASQVVSTLLGLLGGWIAGTLVAGLIVTLLDIRDDINDGLPSLKDKND